MAAATPWRTRATTLGRSKPGWGTRTSSTRCATPSWHRIGSRTSGVDAAGNAGMHDPQQQQQIQPKGKTSPPRLVVSQFLAVSVSKKSPGRGGALGSTEEHPA